jgi:hypothetical protein
MFVLMNIIAHFFEVVKQIEINSAIQPNVTWIIKTRSRLFRIFLVPK